LAGKWEVSEIGTYGIMMCHYLMWSHEVLFGTFQRNFLLHSAENNESLTAGFSKTLIMFCHNKQHYVPEDDNLTTLFSYSE